MDRLVMVGRIMTASTMALEKMPKPVMVWPMASAAPRTAATITVRPIRPYTTDGMPTNSSTSGWNTLRPKRGATSTTKMALPNAMGSANSVDSNVTENEPAIMGSAPTVGMPFTSS